MATRATKEQAIALSPQFEQISQVLISLFRELWRRNRAETARRLKNDASFRTRQELEGNDYDRRDWLDSCKELKHAFVLLHLDKNAEYDQWYQASFVGDTPDERGDSNNKQEMLFWKYFDKHHRNALMEEMGVVPH